MNTLRATLLASAALTTPAFAGGLSSVGFEDGTLAGWTVYGGASVVGDDSLSLGGTAFELAAKGSYMAKILPNGSSVTVSDAESYLGLDSGTFANLGVDGVANGTNFGLITGTFDLDPGTYSFGWSYAAQDYAPYDDGVFFSITGGDLEVVSILASNFTGQDDTVIVGTYGSTPWQLTSFTITTGGSFQLGFGAYNNRDTGLDPILYLDDGIGSLTADGVVVAPAAPSTIDTNQASYAASDVEAGDILPEFDGGVLEVDAPGVYTTDLQVNGDGGTIDTAGLDATFSGDITGVGALTKTGDGALTLMGTNSYAGGTTISGGAVIGDAGSLQGDIVNNATLVFNQTADGVYSGDLSGAGDLTKSGDGVLTMTGDSSGFAGDLALNEGGVLLMGALDGAVTIGADGALQVGDGETAGSLLADVVNNGALTFSNPGDTDFGGALSGSGSLIKEGDGKLTLSGDYSYTGSTVINGGEVEVTSALPSGTDLMVGTGGKVMFGAGSQQVKSLSGGGGISLGGGELTVASDSDSTYEGGLEGSGVFIKSGSGHLNMTGQSSFTGLVNVMDGLLSANGASSASFEVTSGVLGGTGRIGGLIVHTGASAAPGNSIGTLYVDGTVLFEVDSTYVVETNPAGESDQLIATGTLTIEGGTVSVLAGEGDYGARTSYTIAQADGGRTGEFDTVVTDLAFLTPSLSYDANSVYLTLVRNDIDFVDLGVTSNQRAMAYLLEGFDADSELRDAAVTLGAASAPVAFDTLSGEVHATVQNTMVENARKTRVAALHRLAMAEEGTNGAWIRAVRSWGRVNGSANAASGDRETTGFIMGLDTSVLGDVRVGLAGGYTEADMEIAARHAYANVNTAHVVGYAGTKLGPLNARGGVGYSRSEVATSRTAVIGTYIEELRADYDGASLQAFGEIGYEAKVGGVLVEPFANITAMRVWVDDFSEGAAPAALDGSRRRDAHVFTNLGARFTPPSIGPVSFEGMLAWERAHDDTAPVKRVRLGDSQAVSIFGAPLSREAAVIEAEANIKIAANGKASLSYDGHIGDRTNDHAVLATVSFTF